MGLHISKEGSILLLEQLFNDVLAEENSIRIAIYPITNEIQRNVFLQRNTNK